MKNEIRWVAPTTLPSITCSPIRCMLALTPMENLVINVTSMNKECSEDELVMCPWPSGPCFCPSTIPGSLIGRRSKPTQHASTPTFVRRFIKRDVPYCYVATREKCGRRLHTHYRGRNSSPSFHCSGKDIVQGRGVYCLNLGGVQIDKAVVEAFSEL
jgi:hypothetical protein